MPDNEKRRAEIINFAAFGTVMTVLTVLAAYANIRCFRMTKRLIRKKPSLILVLNLNVADIAVPIISWSSFMTQHISAHTNTNIDVIIHKAFWTTLVILGNATILTLSALAVDCFVSIRWPLHYKDIATSKGIKLWIALSWLMSSIAGAGDFFTAMSQAIEYDYFTDAIRDTMVFRPESKDLGARLTSSLTVLLSNILSFLCLLLLVAIYSYVLNKIHQINSSRTLAKQGGLNSEIHAVRTTLMVFASFMLLWLPTLVMNILSAIYPDFLSNLSYIEASIIGYAADTLLMIHSIVDAVIYGARVSNTISRQRRSLATIQDYFKVFRKDPSYTDTFDSLNIMSAKHNVAALAMVPITGRLNKTQNSPTRCGLGYQTIKETGEKLGCNTVFTVEISNLDICDSISVDEGIAINFESGSETVEEQSPNNHACVNRGFTHAKYEVERTPSRLLRKSTSLKMTKHWQNASLTKSSKGAARKHSNTETRKHGPESSIIKRSNSESDIRQAATSACRLTKIESPKPLNHQNESIILYCTKL